VKVPCQPLFTLGCQRLFIVGRSGFTPLHPESCPRTCCNVGGSGSSSNISRPSSTYSPVPGWNHIVNFIAIRTTISQGKSPSCTNHCTCNLSKTDFMHHIVGCFAIFDVANIKTIQKYNFTIIFNPVIIQSFLYPVRILVFFYFIIHILNLWHLW